MLCLLPQWMKAVMKKHILYFELKGKSKKRKGCLLSLLEIGLLNFRNFLLYKLLTFKLYS